MPNFENMNEMRANINLYFDNQLTNDAQQNLLNKVDSDSTCHKIFTQEKNIRDFIKNNVTRPAVSPDLIQNIKNNIKVV